jgi:hypothetical protein
MKNERREDHNTMTRRLMDDVGKTSAAMQVRCGLIAVADKEGNVLWAAFIGDLVERDKDPAIAYRKVLARLAAVNKVLATDFAKQMDIARAKGAKEKPC